MRGNFTRSLSIVLGFEGGYVDDPGDPGGATNHGITQRTYNGWRAGQGLSPAPVRDIDPGHVERIYRRDYWGACRCDELPGPLDLVVFDTAVNCGTHAAGRLLQLAVGTTADGVIGPKTIAAALERDALDVVADVLVSREQFYRGIAPHTQGRYLVGWLKRVEHLRVLLGVR